MTADKFGRKLPEGGSDVGLSAAAGRKASCGGEKSLNVGLRQPLHATQGAERMKEAERGL